MDNPSSAHAAFCLAAVLVSAAATAANGADPVAKPDAKSEPAKASLIKALVVTGKGGQDWRATTAAAKEILTAEGRVTVDVTERPEEDLTADRLAACDVLILNYRSVNRWPKAVEAAVLAAVRGGKGLVVLHGAGGSFAGKLQDGKVVGDWPEFTDMVGGGRASGTAVAARPFQYEVKFADPKHLIAKGLPAAFRHSRDELYDNPSPAPGVHVLAVGGDASMGGPRPLIWVREFGQGRVFHTTLGHTPAAMAGVGYQVLLRRGVEWTATGKVTGPIPETMDSPEER